MRRVLVSIISAAALTVALGTVSVAGAATVTFPKVTGAFGKAPTITFPTSAAPKTLESMVIRHGTGPVLKKGNLFVGNYVGQIWGGKVFDSSFARNETSAFAIGVGAVIKGWDLELPGVRSGSRVVLVVPPVDAYGSTGDTAAGITATSTLVFVVDVVAVYGSTAGKGLPATFVSNGPKGISVKNPLTTAPSITIAKGTKQPTAESITVLDKGKGQKVVPGMLILQYVATTWTNQVVGSTWTQGTPEGEYAGSKTTQSPFDGLVGMPIGTRVLIQLPATTNNGQSQGPFAVALEIAGETQLSASTA